MPNQNNIPDADLKLAKKVGAVLQEDPLSVSSIDDFLIGEIVNYKKNLYKERKKELALSKQESWNQVERNIRKETKSVSVSTDALQVKKLFFPQSTAWRIAAVLLLTALLSILYFQFESGRYKVIAESGSQLVTHTLGDGTIVQLRPNSVLYLVTETERDIHYKLEGEAFFSVTKTGEQRFLVAAGAGTVEVLGTSFNIREWGDETVVFLKEGSLLVTNSDGSGNITLKPGEMASVSDDLSITEPVETDGAEFMAWQQRQIIFNNRRAESIFRELEHHYSIQIIAPDHINNEILGGSLSLESINVSLENLELVLGGKFSSIDDDTYQFMD